MGGSFYSNNIEDYYLTPYELGYGPFVKFDHDFIGREALEKIAGQPHRRKVTFAWNAEDVEQGFPVHARTGRENTNTSICRYRITPPRRMTRCTTAGRSSACPCSAATATTSARCFRWASSIRTSLPAIEVTLVWGEEGGGSKKTTVERHKQMDIRAIVSPVPYSKVAREEYAPGWRTSAAQL